MLQVLSLNTWAGAESGLVGFLNRYARSGVDILLLQEVYRAKASDETVPREIFPKNPGGRGARPIRPHLYDEIAKALPSFDGYFAPQMSSWLHDLESTRHPIEYGNALFVRRRIGLDVLAVTTELAYGQHGQVNTEQCVNGVWQGHPASKSMITTTLQSEVGIVTIGGVHGFWSARGKEDTTERFEQNQAWVSALERHRLYHTGIPNYLLIGDFNYRTGMKALTDLSSQPAFGLGGGVNLNHEFEVNETRTEHYPGDKPWRQADFAFTSGCLARRVTSFICDLSAPSDHGALLLTIG